MPSTLRRYILYFRRTIWRDGSCTFREHPRRYLSQRLYLVFEGLFVDNHWDYAAQLTYNTMMAIIPVFAVIFAVGRGFGFEEWIADWCQRVFESQPQVAEAVVNLSDAYIKYAKTGYIIGISLVFMLYSVVSLFNNVEKVFNGIWGVKKERSLATAAIDYLSMMLLVPLAIILLSGLSVFFQGILRQLPTFQVLTPLVRTLLGLALPLALLTAFFTLMYAYLPNTRVRLRCVWFPALLAAVSISLLQQVYIHCQVVFTSYNVVYGSLAALPLLMLWLQLSWFICIGFAELGRANQELALGRRVYHRDDSLLEQLRHAGVVVALLCRRQQQGIGPATMADLQRVSRHSHAALVHSLRLLTRSHLVARTRRDDGQEVFTLSRDASALTAGETLRALMGRKGAPAPDGENAANRPASLSPAVEREIDRIMEMSFGELDKIRMDSAIG